MKALQNPSQPRQQKIAAQAPPTMEEKITLLSSK
jgi:hypothetical protein